MKIKVFTAFSPEGLEKRVNSFIGGKDKVIKEIQFQASFGMICAMVTYDVKKASIMDDGFKNI